MRKQHTDFMHSVQVLTIQYSDDLACKRNSSDHDPFHLGKGLEQQLAI